MAKPNHHVEKLIIPGPVGQLEAELSVREAYEAGGPVAVICHPHPLYGGSLRNKVVHILADTFTDMGLPTLRFNFRGVGKSEGQFDQGQGEQDDLESVVAWLHERYAAAP
ncbi:MAG: alpha/beta hydrolase, partial [Gammaproteobacteria bacterium]|nr:alpha/beta hydrolase [Gammaproteobacteria bacterium]